MLAPMEPSPRASFEPAGAGALLGGVTAAGVGVGALVGWAAGSVGLGILGGAFVGVPAGVLAVYKRYRNAFWAAAGFAARRARFHGPGSGRSAAGS
jgi:hypothetical protein